MHVAHVLGYLASHYGGPPQVALQLGKALENRGVKVTWWATATKEEQHELGYLGARVRLFPSSFPQFWYRSPALYHALREEINEMDLLHLHQVWDYPLYAAAKLARRHGKPYLVAPHGIFNQTWRYSTLKKKIYLRLIARSFLNKTACIHATVESELGGFGTVGVRAPHTVVPNAIDPGEFANLPAPGEADGRWPRLRNRIVFLFLGRLSPEKGLDQLIAAWRTIVKQCPEVLLMVVGPDNRGYGMIIEGLIEKAELYNHVLMPGMLQGREKLMALSRADVFVQPSYSEALSLSLLEAMACGKPCVISSQCNFPALTAVGAGEIVELGEDTLGTGLLKLLSLSKQERKKMGDRGRSLVLEKYTWDIAAERMLTVYRCILDNKPIPLNPEPRA